MSKNRVAKFPGIFKCGNFPGNFPGIFPGIYKNWKFLAIVFK